MPIDPLSIAAELIAGEGLEFIKDKAKRQEGVIRVLKTLGLDSPLENGFDGVYIYTLVVYGIDKPKPLVDFFRHPFIKNAFRRSFESRDLSYLDEESRNFIDWNPTAKVLLSSFDYDPRQEFAEFREQFLITAKLTRTVNDVLVDHKLQDIQTGVAAIPTVADFNKKIQPIIQGVEILSSREEKLDNKRLITIANESLDRHRERFSLNQKNENEHEIPRDIHETIVESLSKVSKPIIGINGPSGFGKSTLLRQLGRDINNNNQGIALWIPAENITSVISIDELILVTLHKYNPNLSNNAGIDTLELVSQTNIGLVLLIDDVNRTPRPEQIFSTLSALCANAATKDTKIHFVIPLWPGQIATSPDSRTTEKSWEIISLGYFSDIESEKYSQLVNPAKASIIRQFITSLGGDPFLVGLATEDAEKPLSNEVIELLSQIFTYIINETIKNAREVSFEPATPKEFSAAIDSLVELILRAGTPEPTWEQIRKYLGPEKSNLIHALARVNRLGWIDSINGNEIWRWKHTRLRDVIIGRWL
jgi:hypothetical protein